MSYYPTIEEDLVRAKQILETGKPSPWERANFTPEVIDALRQVGSGMILPGDMYAAYKLLESFVAAIEAFQLDQRMLATTIRNIVVAVTGNDTWEGTVAEARDVLNQHFTAKNAEVEQLQTEVADFQRSFALYDRSSLQLMTAYKAVHPEIPEQVWPDAAVVDVWAAEEIERLRTMTAHAEDLIRTNLQIIEELRVDLARERAVRRVVDEALRQAMDLPPAATPNAVVAGGIAVTCPLCDWSADDAEVMARIQTHLERAFVDHLQRAHGYTERSVHPFPPDDK